MYIFDLLFFTLVNKPTAAVQKTKVWLDLYLYKNGLFLFSVTSSEIVLEDCDDFKALEHSDMMKENGKSREEKKLFCLLFFILHVVLLYMYLSFWHTNNFICFRVVQQIKSQRGLYCKKQKEEKRRKK